MIRSRLKGKGLKIGSWVCFALLILFLISGVRAEVPEGVKTAVKGFVLRYNPEWADGEIKVSVRGSENFFEKFASEKKAVYKVPQDYKLSRITPSLVLPLAVYIDGEEVARSYLTVRIEVLRSVVVAKAKINKRQAIADPDLTLATKDVALYPNKYFTETDKARGKMAATLIPQGTVILEWMLKDKPAVAKGGKVNILVRTEGIEVWSSGLALTDGQIGETIQVRRADSRNKLDARVLSADVVEVKM